MSKKDGGPAHCLSGKTIIGIDLAEDKKAIRFRTLDAEVIARTDGDCCSDTWVESIETPARGFPAKVTQVRGLGWGDRDETLGECDVVRHYGLSIVTDRGEIIIDYRNASNGYYGGDLVWPGGYYYGGAFGQNKSDCVWRDVLAAREARDD